MDDDFKAGDIVVLKTGGGPRMMVEDVGTEQYCCACLDVKDALTGAKDWYASGMLALATE